MTLTEVRKALRDLADPVIAEHSQRFFKSGPGEYGEGDKCLGIRVPEQRKVARAYRELSTSDVVRLLKSPWHEERSTALFIFVLQFKKADDAKRGEIYNCYLQHTRWVNNWDLVDCSAHPIVGAYLFDRNRRPLAKLAKSNSLWERRIAIIATFYFIKQHDFGDTLKVAEQLLHDTEDLIRKAVGWMLREVGNKDRNVEEAFLQQHYHNMPRTMLRYAIEKFPERLRKSYLQGTA